jgi:hypothetical protein
VVSCFAGSFLTEQKGKQMSAKHKLNQAYLLGALIVAGVLGGVTGSWAVFFITLAALVALSYHAGEIRR